MNTGRSVLEICCAGEAVANQKMARDFESLDRFAV